MARQTLCGAHINKNPVETEDQSVPHSTDVSVERAALYLLPVTTRMPIKFGPEVLTEVTCARVKLTVRDERGRTADGWGETPLNVQWAWPSAMSYVDRHQRLVDFCQTLTAAWADFDAAGHPLEIGSDFFESRLTQLQQEHNAEHPAAEPLPYLAALVCTSAFDIALYDAYGNLHGVDSYKSLTAEHLNRDLASYLQPVAGSHVSFAGRYPADYLTKPSLTLAAWHLIGGLDPLDESELTGDEPDDGYPVTLTDWIERDGLKCLKVKLRGNDWDWDFARLQRVGDLAQASEVTWLTADFNCTVSDPGYVNTILDRLRDDHPLTYGQLLYVEQPFPYDLDRHAIDCRSVAARKPVFLDESAHDWRHVRRGRELGWSGVALKTCKTQTGALLSLCWAKAHGMPLMVQDLANPMLAQLAHLRLAAHAGTIMGVETNGMQFYPEASRPEAQVHPGMYRRRDGCVELGSLGESGMGYRIDAIDRALPEPIAVSG